jgi:hypothetical protein
MGKWNTHSAKKGTATDEQRRPRVERSLRPTAKQIRCLCPQSSFLLSLQENHRLPQMTAEIRCEPRHTVLVNGSGGV